MSEAGVISTVAGLRGVSMVVAPRKDGGLRVKMPVPQAIERVELVSGPDLIAWRGQAVEGLQAALVADQDGIILSMGTRVLSALCSWRILDGSDRLVASVKQEDLDKLTALGVVEMVVKPAGRLSDLSLVLSNGWVLEFFSESETGTWELAVVDGRADR